MEQTTDSQPIEIEPSEAAVECNPTQFGLSDLFALMTLASMLLAIFAPICRAAFEGQGTSALLILFMQFSLVGVCGFWVTKQRLKSVQLGGAKLGAGFCGIIRWRHWPKVASWLVLLSISSFELLLALMFAIMPMMFISIQLVMCQVQLAFFTSRAFLCFASRVYPNSIEFFERGIVLYGTWFMPWSAVTVRPSSLYPDRIVVVYQLRPDMPSGILNVVQVTDGLRRQVFAAASKLSEPK